MAIWLVVYPPLTPLKNMQVSWDYDIPNRWKKMFQTTNQLFWMVQFTALGDSPRRKLRLEIPTHLAAKAQGLV